MKAWSRATLLLSSTAWIGCAANTEPCTQAPVIYQPTLATQPTTATTPAASASETNRPRSSLAVLPIVDHELYRQERKLVRAKLHATLAQLAGTEFELPPLAEVDAKIARVSRSSKARCAFDRGSLRARAEEEGYLVVTTNVVLSGDLKGAEQLWVQAAGSIGDSTLWKGPWDRKLPRVQRYEAAFNQLQPAPSGGLVDVGGVLSGHASDTKSGVTFCEPEALRCSQETAGWIDVAPQVAQCFGDRARAHTTLLLEPGAPAPSCEIDGLDDPSTSAAALESCLCTAIRSSARSKSLTKRMDMTLEYEAKDIAGRSEPFVTVIDASTNLRAEERSYRESSSAMRTGLSLDGLKDLASALARCEATNVLVVAEVELDDTGSVRAAKVASGAKGKQAACIEKQLSKAGFDCTRDGKPATVRLAIRWASAADDKREQR